MGKSLIHRLNHIFPPLKSKGLKGEHGRIGVIGGSYEFTGAPFYSAMSALKAGADLAHIFCSKSSSVSIKSYSPEIIVHPIFTSEEEVRYSKEDRKKVIGEWLQKIRSWEKAIHTWVIGPGLGRDPYMQEFFPYLVRSIGKNKVVIFDADGLYYLAQNPDLFASMKNYKAILTPNKRQLTYLKPYLNIDLEKSLVYEDNREEIQQLPEQYNRIHDFSVIVKGENDIILGPESYVVKTEGGRKRCGGIGDILAGITAVCGYWHFQLGPVLASRIVKVATKRAFIKEGRGLTAPYIIREISSSVNDIQAELI